jgi:SlyX protein
MRRPAASGVCGCYHCGPITTVDAAMSDAITDLQIRFAEQDDALQTLTRTVLDQERQIGELRAQIEQLKSMVRELAPPQVGPQGSEPPPPHY